MSTEFPALLQNVLKAYRTHDLQTKEILVEESNVQPVNSPVTVRPSAAQHAAMPA